jgi:hypothetical protein
LLAFSTLAFVILFIIRDAVGGKTVSTNNIHNIPVNNTKLIKFFPAQRELKGLEARH